MHRGGFELRSTETLMGMKRMRLGFGGLALSVRQVSFGISGAGDHFCYLLSNSVRSSNPETPKIDTLFIK